MTTMRNLTITGILLLLFVVIACTDNFEEINTDPTSVTDVPPEMLFTRGIVYGALRYDVYQRAKDLHGNRYSQYFANTQTGWGTDRYETNQDWLTRLWTSSYSDFGINNAEAIQKTEDDPDLANLNAQARIWHAFTMHRVTDFFGDVPFSEAFQEDLRPVYDTQEDIYNHMLEDLRDAVDQLDEGLEYRTGDADVLFHDDLDQWRRFGNSLRLRLAMRIAYADPDLAREHVTDVLNTGLVITSNNQNAFLETDPGGGTGDLVHENPMYWVFSFDEYRVSEKMIDRLTEYDDPRLEIFARPNVRRQFAGLPNGLSDSQLGDHPDRNYSTHGAVFVQQETPVPFITYAEVKFLEAEAALRGWGPGNAADHYEEGIRAHMEHLNWLIDYVERDLENDKIAQDEIDDYISQSGVAYQSGAGFEEQLEQIMTQKWLALYGQGLEAWAEIRRTGYPELYEIAAPGGGETDGQLPRRVRYPSEEEGLNPENLRDAIERQGGDPADFRMHPTVRPWWDANPDIHVDEM